MNSYERVVAVLEGRTPDILPVAPFLSNHAAYIENVPVSEYYCDGHLMAKVLYSACERYGYDMIFAQSDNYYISEGMGVVTKKEGNNLPEVIKTPVSSFREAARTFKVPNPETDGRMPVYLTALSDLAAKLKGKVALRGTGTGMFSLFSHLYGLQDYLMDVAEMQMGVEDEDPDAIEDEKCFFEAMEILTETLVRFHTAEIEAGADVVHMGDSLGSLNVISPATFRRYVLPYLKKYYEAMQPIFKKHHAFGLLHICGDNTAVLEDYISTGCDLYEMDWKMDLGKSLKQIDGRMVILGNINPASFARESADEVAHLCSEAISAAAPFGHFMLGTGCETGMYTPIENVHAMVRTGHAVTF